MSLLRKVIKSNNRQIWHTEMKQRSKLFDAQNYESSSSKSSRLNSRFGRRKRTGNYFRLPRPVLMRAIAKRLILGKATTAQRNSSATGKIELITVLVEDFEFSFDSDASVIANGDLG